jgi:hypothetical protein
MKRSTIVTAIVVALTSLQLAAFGQEQTETYDATALVTTNRGPSNIVRFTITIERETSDADVARLADLLRAEGQEAVLEDLEDVEVGSIRAAGTLPHTLNFARSRNTEGGRRITLASARPMTFFEIGNQTRSSLYEFGIIQLEVDEAGSGEGTMIVAAQVGFNDENVLVVEGFGQQPIRLTRVERTD